jgi:DNA-binding response OmpR family regulator
MPKLRGYEVCQELRADRTLARQPYVIVLTARGETADRERAKRAGVDEFMTKLIGPSKLRGRVTELLGVPDRPVLAAPTT